MNNVGKVIWITGLSGSGKTTIASEVVKQFEDDGLKVCIIDGDGIREAMGNDLGYHFDDRLKSAYRMSRLANMLSQQGLNVVVATISLFKEIHDFNRSELKNYIEVYIESDIALLQSQNSKNIYTDCNVDEVVGLGLSYHLPDNPNLTINNTNREQGPVDIACQIFQYAKRY